MRHLQLNLATRPIERVRTARRQVGWLLIGLLGVTVLHVGAFGWLGRAAAGDAETPHSVDTSTLREWSRQVDRLSAAADVQRARATATAVGLANQLVAWRTIPWMSIFAAVEEALPQRARLESVEPITEPGGDVRVVITAAARDPGPLQDLLVALEQHEGFVEVYPRQETQGIDGLYRIDLQARYLEPESGSEEQP